MSSSRKYPIPFFMTFPNLRFLSAAQSSQLIHLVEGYCRLSLILLIATAVTMAIKTPTRNNTISSMPWLSLENTTDVAPAGG
jgi:hypothetical protein